MHADHVVVEFCLSLALAGASVAAWASPPQQSAGSPEDAFAGAAALSETDRRADIRRALHARDDRYMRVEAGQFVGRRALSLEERRALRLELDAAVRDAYGRHRAARTGLVEREHLAGD